MKSASCIVLFIAFASLTLASGQARPSQLQFTGGVLTLYAADPTGQSLCFNDNAYGLVIQEGQVRNRCSDLNFNSYSKNGFSTGVEGGRQGWILDLGTAEELQKRYGYQETVTPGQGFASIAVVDGRLSILKDYRSGSLQDLDAAKSLFDSPSSIASVPVKLNHIYVLRIADTNDKLYEQLAKFVVLAFVPDQSVTIRWEHVERRSSSSVSLQIGLAEQSTKR
jgi:hypothetical protein